MNRLFRTLQFVAQWITLGLAAAFLIGLFAPQWSRNLRERVGASVPSESSPAASAATSAATKEAQSHHHSPGFGPGNAPAESGSERDARTVRSASYSSAVARAAPAVVSIYADTMETRVEQRALVPKDPQLLRIFGALPLGPPIRRSLPAQSLGSGVIVNDDGYLLTNFHVIKDATNIKAVLQDGRVVIAKLIGTDEETDLAVLRLDATYLNTLPISGQNPTVGDVVLAIGNPFGLGNTVTMGIVSALGRQVNPSNGEEFIQTDAAINQGNSGGALVNTAGELVGINSNNYSPSGGGSVGIGFAIPVSTAKNVLDQIIAHGRVVRAWIGASYRDAVPDATDITPLGSGGAVITAVEDGGPAARAGLRAGDVINRFDGVWVPNQFALRNREAHLDPGKKVSVTGSRDGKALNLEIVLAEKPVTPAAPAGGADSSK